MVAILTPRTLEKRPYRLRCRFKIEPRPRLERLATVKVRVAEQFVSDMRKQGWVHDNRHPFVMKGPFTPIIPITLHPRRMPTAREMLAGVMRGERYRDNAPSEASLVVPLMQADYWEFEIAAVFIRTQILTERPDAHEEQH